MADPLQKDDFRSLPVDEDLDEGVGTAIAYPVRSEAPMRQYPTASGSDVGLNLPKPGRQLPEGGSRRLNRAAEQVGTAVGRAVVQARRVPDSARDRLHLVRDRVRQASNAAAERISGSASSLVDAAEQRARNLTAATEEKARDFMDRAEGRARVALDEMDELGRKAAERASRIKQDVEERSRKWRIEARLRARQIRMQGERLVEQHPLKVLGCIAGAAFLAGISLRIVRARNARR